ncbi:aquaporin-like protein [Trichodelitschia bisporula]|uniref:Aquaporin-like protein n=1 Tax=Trichodelitschia bisporula TaxID=703511 RepID=A0A6G1IB23_9PEZI|nr:aquaporin-like protein [Trichodelitschia bisporula]
MPWKGRGAKGHMITTLSELFGTTLFLFCAFAGIQAAGSSSGLAFSSIAAGPGPDAGLQALVYISLSFGLSLMVNAWIFCRTSGAYFNPAVTLALLLSGDIGSVRAACLFVAQIAGSIAASELALGLFPANIDVRTVLNNKISIVRGLFIEAILSAELVFTVLVLAKEKTRAYLAPAGVGAALFVGELVGVHWTGGSLNPARSFGPCVVTNMWDRTHWVYWAGPTLGCMLAVTFHRFIKALEN